MTDAKGKIFSIFHLKERRIKVRRASKGYGVYVTWGSPRRGLRGLRCMSHLQEPKVCFLPLSLPRFGICHCSLPSTTRYGTETKIKSKGNDSHSNSTSEGWHIHLMHAVPWKASFAYTQHVHFDLKMRVLKRHFCEWMEHAGVKRAPLVGKGIKDKDLQTWIREGGRVFPDKINSSHIRGCPSVRFLLKRSG